MPLCCPSHQTDVDLHVLEPTGEECLFSHNRTSSGGFLSKDFQRGYGPEEYLIKKAVPGDYIVKAKYFSNHQQSLSGATTLMVIIYKYYGQYDREERQMVTMRLSSNKELIEVCRVTFEDQTLPALKQQVKHLTEQNTFLIKQLKQFDPSFTTKNDIGGLVHKGVICDGCGQPVIGERYKCMFCTNIDFCSGCASHSITSSADPLHQPTHPLIRIRDSSLFPNSLWILNRARICHVGISCNQCQINPIIGVRYRCSCGINICEVCEFSGIHDFNHTRTKFNTPQK